MSSGIATKTYGVTLGLQQHVEISKSNKNYLQRQKFDLLSMFVSELFTHKNSKDAIKNISNLIILSLKSFKNNPQSNLSSKQGVNPFFESISVYRNNSNQKTNNPFMKYGKILDILHSIIANCPDLPNNEKLEYCTIERFFIKSVFKELALII